MPAAPKDRAHLPGGRVADDAAGAGGPRWTRKSAKTYVLEATEDWPAGTVDETVGFFRLKAEATEFSFGTFDRQPAGFRIVILRCNLYPPAPDVLTRR